MLAAAMLLFSLSLYLSTVLPRLSVPRLTGPRLSGRPIYSPHVVRCHLRYRKPLRARVLRLYDVICGTINRCAHVFHGRTMSSKAP